MLNEFPKLLIIPTSLHNNEHVTKILARGAIFFLGKLVPGIFFDDKFSIDRQILSQKFA